MSEQKSRQRNKPEKLDLPESPKSDQERKIIQQNQPPFRVQLRQIRAEAEDQILKRLVFNRKEYIRKIEQLRKSKVVVYYSIHFLEPKDFETVFDLLSALGKQKNLDLYIL